MKKPKIKMTNQNSKIYKITGMDCPSCAMLIESELEDLGIKAKASYAKQTLNIEDSPNFSEDRIKSSVEKLGYKLINK